MILLFFQFSKHPPSTAGTKRTEIIKGKLNIMIITAKFLNSLPNSRYIYTHTNNYQKVHNENNHKKLSSLSIHIISGFMHKLLINQVLITL